MALRPIKKIIVTGDLLRLVRGTTRPSQNENISWFYHLIKRPLQQATGISSERLLAEAGQFDLVQFYQFCGLEPSLTSWCRIYEASELPEQALEMLLLHFHDALVVGFELNDVFRRAFEYLQIPYIDVIIHPVRFLDDIFFGFASNRKLIFEAAMEYRLSEDLIEEHSSVIEATVARLPPMLPDDIGVLLCGQTNDDKTLIRQGEIVNFSNFANQVRELAAPGLRVAFKAHPYNKGDFGLFSTGLAYNSVLFTNENFYKLMCQANIRAVASLSSSTSYEARYFGREGKYLYKAPFSLVSEASLGFSRDLYVGVLDAFWRADFWSDLLSSEIPVLRGSASNMPAVPNRLRMSLGSFWGFNELTTDIAVGLYRKI